MNVVVAIAWRPGGHRRQQLCTHVRTAITAALPDATVMTVDTDHEPYNLAAVRNRGVELAEVAGADVVVLHDADTLAEPEAYGAAVAGAYAMGRVHLPYTRYRALSQRGTRLCLRGADLSMCPADDEHPWATGGILITRPDIYWRAGGSDDRFRGWGYEDTAYRAAHDTLVGPMAQVPGTVYHLWHPLAPRGVDTERNAALMARYVQAEGDRAAMSALVGEHRSAAALATTP